MEALQLISIDGMPCACACACACAVLTGLLLFLSLFDQRFKTVAFHRVFCYIL